MTMPSGNILEDDSQRRHLATEDVRSNLKRRTILGGLVSAGAQGCQLVLILTSNVVLARLLSPVDFGLVAMAATVAALLQVFRDAGLATATIQREHITHAQVSNLFWINVGVSAIVCLAMVMSAPFIAWFFRAPQLVRISLALSGGFLLSGLTVQHMALFSRQMQFNTVSMIEAGSTAVGVLVGIGMALMRCGYWSLVGLNLSTAAVRLIAAWATSPWRPQAFRRQSGTSALVRFGADLTLVGVFYSVARSSDSILIGRFLGPTAVGLYSRATALLTRPLEQLITPIYSVVVPALSRLQSQPDRYRRAFLQVFEGLVIVGCLFTGLFLPLAHPLVAVVLGQKWEGAAPIFAALTIAAVYLPISTATSWLYTSQGRGRTLLLMAAIGGCVMIASFVLGLPFGPRGVAVAYSLSGIFVQLPLTFHLAGRSGPVSTTDLWSAFIRHSPICLVVLTVTWLTSSSDVAFSPLPRLLLSATAGLLAGAATVLLSSPSRRAATRILGALNELRIA
jgi:polysaccharide transporter, PST family